jgi:hypothetical protein
MTKISDYIRGDTRVINITCVESDGTTPINLTGATVYFTLNSSKTPTSDASASLQKTVTSHSDPNNGITSITINPADTQALTPGVYYYDVQLVDASGHVTSLKQDTFKINADITRS